MPGSITDHAPPVLSCVTGGEATPCSAPPSRQGRLGARDYPVFVNDLPGIGRYGSVNLISNTAGIESMAEARTAVKALGDAFRIGLSAAFEDDPVRDPGRRDLLRGRLPDTP